MANEKFRVLVVGLGREDASKSAVVAQAIDATGMAYSFVEPMSLTSINAGIVRTDAVVAVMKSANFSFFVKRPHLGNLELQQLVENIVSVTKAGLPIYLFLIADDKRHKKIQDAIVRDVHDHLQSAGNASYLRVHRVTDAQFDKSIRDAMVHMRSLMGFELPQIDIDVDIQGFPEDGDDALRSGAQQRPATYRFGVQGNKITALPDPLETSDDQTAQDIYDELTAKVQMLAERMRLSDSHRGARQAAVNVKQVAARIS